MRASSPPSGFSILITSAPMSASNTPARGPARAWPTSMTRTPSSGRVTIILSSEELLGGLPLRYGLRLDPGRQQRPFLGARQVVGPVHHDALRAEPAPGLQRHHELPAAIGVGGEVADQVVDPHAVLDIDIRLGVQVFADVLAGLRMAQVGLH